jgi:hypothetical protein
VDDKAGFLSSPPDPLALWSALCTLLKHFPLTKRTEREADHLSPSDAKVKNVWNFTLVNMGLQALITPIKAQWFLHESSGFYVLTAVFLKLQFFRGVTLFP